MRGFGNLLIIDHGDQIMTLHAHLQQFSARPGQQVSRGDEIGRVGVSGGQTRAALYFEVRRGGEPINPSVGLRVVDGISCTTIDVSAVIVISTNISRWRATASPNALRSLHDAICYRGITPPSASWLPCFRLFYCRPRYRYLPNQPVAMWWMTLSLTNYP